MGLHEKEILNDNSDDDHFYVNCLRLSIASKEMMSEG